MKLYIHSFRFHCCATTQKSHSGVFSADMTEIVSPICRYWSDVALYTGQATAPLGTWSRANDVQYPLTMSDSAASAGPDKNEASWNTSGSSAVWHAPTQFSMDEIAGTCVRKYLHSDRMAALR
jgi:hypothetical protein